MARRLAVWQGGASSMNTHPEGALWERACSRWRCVSQHSHREQARSHRIALREASLHLQPDISLNNREPAR
ncbi:hypothetical protein FGE05_13025 [Pseudomonas sp. ICMP22404]|nr:hypothetical protein FGE05_13025 [Pseudomonas sp. ICMP22404]